MWSVEDREAETLSMLTLKTVSVRQKSTLFLLSNHVEKLRLGLGRVKMGLGLG